MSSEACIYIGGEDHYVIDCFETIPSNRSITMKNSHIDGTVCVQLEDNGKFCIENSTTGETCKIENDGIVTCVDTVISGHGSLSEAVFGTIPPTTINVIDGLTIFPNALVSNNLTISASDVASISSSFYNNFIMYNIQVSTSYAQFDITTPSHNNYIIGIVDKYGIDNSTNTSNWMTNAIMTYNFGLTASFSATNCTVRYNGSTNNLNYTTSTSTAQPDKLQIGINNTTSSIEFILISGSSVLRTLKIVYAYGFPFGNLTNKRICMSISDTSTTVEAPETPMAWQGTLTGLTYISDENDNTTNSRVGRLENELASIESYMTNISGTYISSDKPGQILDDKISNFGTRINTLETAPVYPDNVAISFGDSSDLSIQHNSTNSIINNDTGDLQINNTVNNKKIILKLGSTNANTAFEVQDNTGNVLFSVDGSGTMTGISIETSTYITSISTFPLPAKKEEISFIGEKPIYAYLDTSGRRLKFNKGKIFITESGSNTCTFYLAIYKLTGSATFNDLSTYNNSTRTVMSSPVSWSNSSGTSGNGEGFCYFSFSTTTLDATGDYFVGLFNSTSSHKYLSWKDAGDTNKGLDNLYYIGNSSEPIPGNNMLTTNDTSKKGDPAYIRLYYE